MKAITPLRAIRKHCVQCCCGSIHEVNLCPDTECDLYPYRLGHNPSRKGQGGKGNPDALKKYRKSVVESKVKA